MTGYSSPAPVYHSTPAPRPAASCKIYSKFPDPPSSKLKPQPRAVLRVLRPPGVRSLLASAGAHFMLQLPTLYWAAMVSLQSWSCATPGPSSPAPLSPAAPSTRANTHPCSTTLPVSILISRGGSDPSLFTVYACTQANIIPLDSSYQLSKRKYGSSGSAVLPL